MTVMYNAGAQLSLGEVNKNINKIGKSLSRLSSGQKFYGVQENSADYAISEKIREQIRSLFQDDQNIQNGSSMVKTAERGIAQIVDNLRIMKELAIDAANDSNTDEDRRTIQKEIDQRREVINDIALGTKYNGKILLDGTYAKKIFTEYKQTGWLEPPKNFTMVPGKTYEKTVNADGSRLIIGVNDVQDMTRSFKAVDTSIGPATSVASGGGLSYDIGFTGINSDWNWAKAYREKIFTGEDYRVYFENTQTTPSTPQQVIRAFMSSLDETALKGNDALDEAIDYSTGGTIKTKDDLVNKFILKSARIPPPLSVSVGGG